MSALPMPIAPRVGSSVFTDEQVEFYGARYIAVGIGMRGVTFEQYIADPRRYDNFDPSLDPLPLNAKQLRVQRKLLAVTSDTNVADAKRRDSGIHSVNPLPLNSKQRRVWRRLIDDELSHHVKRIEREVQNLPRRNGRVIEPLRHHRFPRSIPNFSPRSDK